MDPYVESQLSAGLFASVHRKYLDIWYNLQTVVFGHSNGAAVFLLEV